MRKLTSIILILIGFISSCEIILEFPEENENSVLVLNAIADTDSTFSAIITRTLPSNSVFPGHILYEYDDILYGDHTISGFHDDFNMKKHVVRDAKIHFQVNDSVEELMYYDSLLFKYRCNYTPKEGDKIKVWCESGNQDIIYAETIVPTKQKIEILELNKVYSEIDCGCTDTIIRINLSITDPDIEKNYYRLKVRCASGFYEDVVSDFETSNGYPVVYRNRLTVNDYYTSNDPLFYVEDLYKGDVWPAHFSPIFNDTLIDGQNYPFTVEIRQVLGTYMDSSGNTHPHDNPYIYIELVSITEDMYKYLKSMMKYRISESDPYTELKGVYSNIDGGYGILGASSSSDIFIDLTQI
ncbi:MAG: DUF4249 domain-containing protein [Bacteroidales bacterium]|nr:DUF4249 domain-containing protein [Bacteroidales bacterium]